MGSYGIGYTKSFLQAVFSRVLTPRIGRKPTQKRGKSALSMRTCPLFMKGKGGCLGCLVGWCWDEIMFWMGPSIRSNRETPFLKQSRISCGKEGSRRSPVFLVACLGLVVFFVLFRLEVVLGRWRYWTQKLYGQSTYGTPIRNKA